MFVRDPDRVLIGDGPSEGAQAVVQKLVRIYAQWVDQDRILTTNLWPSELSAIGTVAFFPPKIVHFRNF